ncbi:MAG TPA: hypothetical protein VJT71_20700, partial [Pyrinomonadaceae bacterium]|nr:hypothetical protein [Pyrinomonadaceae bacterium]
MTTSPTKDQLAELLQQSREYAKYSAELGIETVTMTEIIESQPVETEVPSPAARPTTSRPPQTSPPAHAATAKAAPAKAAADLLFEELASPEPALSHSDESLESIWVDIGDCTRCGLCAGRTQVVNTNGNPRARLMFVGEAPG